MNTEEKIIRALAIVLVIGGAILQVSHLLNQTNSRSVANFGFILGIVAYSRYAQRLKVENAALQRQLQQGQEP